MNKFKEFFANNTWNFKLKDNKYYIMVLDRFRHLKELSSHMPSLKKLKEQIKERLNKMKFLFTQQFYLTLKLSAGIAIIFVAFHRFCIFLHKRKNVLKEGKRNHVHGILFGMRKNKKIVYSPTQQEGHTIVLGSSGTGKSSAILIPTLNSLNNDDTCLAIDIAGDICKNVSLPNKIVYEPADATSIPYNVFASIDRFKNIDDKNQALEQLAFQLMPDDEKASDASRFYTTEGRKILTASLIAFYHQGMDFINICEKIVFSSWKDLFIDIDESNCPKASQYINSFQGASEINTAGCKQSCDAVLKLFATNEQIKKTVRRPDKGEPCFSPDTLETNSVFVVIQDYCLKLYAPLLHLITSQCFEFFSQRNTQATHTILLALDEFASFGYLDMTDALRKLRKKHVRIMVLSQSLADLDLIYGSEERKAMINNFRFRVLLGATDADTQEYFSKLIGYKITTRRGVSRSGRGKTTSVTETKDYAVEPSSLAQLKNDLIVLSDDGYEKLQKNYYFKKR